MRFIIKISLFCLLLVATYLFFVDKLSKGYVDEYYNKFTQESGSLIIGASRAQQGISPYILENELKCSNLKKPLINFAFDGFQSPYGEVYFKAIQRKTNSANSNSLFILSISPGSFSAFSEREEEVLKMDKNMKIGKVTDFTSNPNYEYIMECYGNPLYNAFYPTNGWKHAISHTNGWNEIKTKNGNYIIKESDIKQWKTQTLESYNKKLENEVISKYRLNSFLKTLSFLKNKGVVILVRLPADSSFINMENNLWESFDKQFDSLSKKYGVTYLNYSHLKNNYKTYDGSHMVSESAKEFTKRLSIDIKEYLKKKQ